MKFLLISKLASIKNYLIHHSFKMKGLLLLFFAVFFWGTSSLFVKELGGYLSVAKIMFPVALLSLIFSYIIYRKKINSEFTNIIRDYRIWFFCLTSIGSIYTETISIKTTSISNAAFIASLFIFIVPVLKRIHNT